MGEFKDAAILDMYLNTRAIQRSTVCPPTRSPLRLGLRGASIDYVPNVLQRSTMCIERERDT